VKELKNLECESLAFAFALKSLDLEWKNVVVQNSIGMRFLKPKYLGCKKTLAILCQYF